MGRKGGGIWRWRVSPACSLAVCWQWRPKQFSQQSSLMSTCSACTFSPSQCWYYWLLLWYSLWGSQWWGWPQRKQWGTPCLGAAPTQHCWLVQCCPRPPSGQISPSAVHGRQWSALWLQGVRNFMVRCLRCMQLTQFKKKLGHKIKLTFGTGY